MSIEDIWTHWANRTIWELDNVCMNRKCIICEYTYKYYGDMMQ